MSNRNRSKKKYTPAKKKVDKYNVAAILVNIVIFIEIIAIVVSISKYFGFVSYKDLNNAIGEQNIAVTDNEYFYDIVEYGDERYKEKTEYFDRLHSIGILDNKTYKYLKSGLESDYFNNSMILDYESYQKEAQAFIDICDVLRNMDYGDVDVEVFDTDEDTMFDQYLKRYIRPDKQAEFADLEQKYMEAIQGQYDNLNFTEGELKYYYEVWLAGNIENIKNIEVELTYLTIKNMYLSDAALNWLVRSPMASGLRHTTTINETDVDAISSLNLILDAGLYDSNIVPNVSNMLYQLGTQLENTSGNDVAIIDVTGIEDIQSYVDKKKAEKAKNENIRKTRRAFTVSTTDRLEGEEVYIIFNVKSCEHKTEFADFDEFIDSKYFVEYRRNMVEQDFWNDMYETVTEEETQSE